MLNLHENVRKIHCFGLVSRSKRCVAFEDEFSKGISISDKITSNRIQTTLIDLI